MSQVLVSIDVPRLILGVETSFDLLLGHPAHSLYGKRFDAFIGPCTNFDLLNNVIMNAGLFCGSADVLITFHELNGHPRLMLVSSAPCTRVENHPICCLLTLIDPDVLFPSGQIRTSYATAPTNWPCTLSQSDIFLKEDVSNDTRLAPRPIDYTRFRTENTHNQNPSGEKNCIDQRHSASGHQRIRQGQLVIDNAYDRRLLRQFRAVERRTARGRAQPSQPRVGPALHPAGFARVDSIPKSSSSPSVSCDPTPSVSTSATTALEAFPSPQTLSPAFRIQPHPGGGSNYAVYHLSADGAGKPRHDILGELGGPRKGAVRQAITEAGMLAVGLEPEGGGNDEVRVEGGDWSGFGGGGGGWPAWGNSAVLRRASLVDSLRDGT